MTEEEKKEFEEFQKWKKEHKKEDNSTTKNPQVPNSESMGQTQSSVNNTSVPSAPPTNNTQNIPKKKNKGCITGIIIAFVIFFIIICAGTCGNTNTNSMSDTTVVDTAIIDSTDEHAVSTQTKKGWEISKEKDEMDDSENVWASIVSDNVNDIGYPYNEVSLTLTVRKMKKYGIDVIVQSSNGQIYGQEYQNDNYVTIRFDNNPATKYYFDTASDGSSDEVFLQKKSTFIANAKKAHTIKVEVPYFQAGRQLFTFTVDEPLVWKY